MSSLRCIVLWGYFTTRLEIESKFAVLRATVYTRNYNI